MPCTKTQSARRGSLIARGEAAFAALSVSSRFTHAPEAGGANGRLQCKPVKVTITEAGATPVWPAAASLRCPTPQAAPCRRSAGSACGADEVGDALGDHDGREIGVGAGHTRHDRGVGYA